MIDGALLKRILIICTTEKCNVVLLNVYSMMDVRVFSTILVFLMAIVLGAEGKM